MTLSPADLASMHYCVFDQECLSLGVVDNKMIQLAAVVLGPSGEELGSFSEYINPGCPIPKYTTSINGITDAMVSKKPKFAIQGAAFLDFLERTVKQHPIVLVGHNISSLDIPLLLTECQRAKINFPANVKYSLDTRYLAQQRMTQKPQNFKLGTVYSHLFREDLKGAHDALIDTRATVRIFKDQSIWPYRGKVKDLEEKVNRYIKRTQIGKVPADLGANETMNSDDEFSDDEDNEEQGDEEDGDMDADGWSKKNSFASDKPFVGPNPGPDARIKPSGPKAAFLSLWMTVEEMVVTETNRYAMMKRAARVIKTFLSYCVENRGVRRSGPFQFPYLCPWIPVTSEDIRKFLCILCLSSAHNRVTNIREWWSKDPLCEFPQVKTIMPRDRFLSILKYLHVANPYDQLQAGGDKVFKVRKFMTALNSVFQKRYKPSRHLTVDEMMIKFKGRLGIIQFMPRKPVKKGIRGWACSDATSGYVLNVDVYCGANTGGREEGVGLGESVVMHLLEPYQHLGHTVTMDRFFTGVPLFESLLDVSIYATGTIQASRSAFPKKALSMPKGSARGTTKWLMKNQLVASKNPRSTFLERISSHPPFSLK